MCGIALLLQRRQAGLDAGAGEETGETRLACPTFIHSFIASPLDHPLEPSVAEWLAALREAIYPRGPDTQVEEELECGEWRAHMLGAVLHMRGPEPR